MPRDTVVVPAATPMQQAARWTKTKIAPAEAPRAQVGGGDLPQHTIRSRPRQGPHYLARAIPARSPGVSQLGRRNGTENGMVGRL
jgi:hypothetical protein